MKDRAQEEMEVDHSRHRTTKFSKLMCFRLPGPGFLMCYVAETVVQASLSASGRNSEFELLRDVLKTQNVGRVAPKGFSFELTES